MARPQVQRCIDECHSCYSVCFWTQCTDCWRVADMSAYVEACRSMEVRRQRWTDGH